MLALRTRLHAVTADFPQAYWFLWLGTVINRLGGFVVPFLSLYLTSQRGIRVSEAGLIVSLFGAGSFLSQLTGGELTDRLGRRPVLLMSLLVTPFITITLGLVRTLPLIAGATLLMGFFTDLYRPAVSAAVSDLVPSHARARAFGYLYWAINLGAALAPIIAGFAARLNYFLLFAGDALTTLLYGLIIWRRVPETQPSEAVHMARISPRGRIRQLRREPILLIMTGLTLMFASIYMQGNVTLPLDMSRQGLGPSDYGLAIAANGILIILITIQLSKLIGRLPRFGAMSIAALLTGIGFGVVALAGGLPVYVLSVIIWTVGEIISASVAPAIIADLAPVELRGLYQGIFGSAWGLSLFIGPLVGSWVFDCFGPHALWLGCAVLGSAVAFAFLVLAGPAHRRLART
jgi:MFS family permease